MIQSIPSSLLISLLSLLCTTHNPLQISAFTHHDATVIKRKKDNLFPINSSCDYLGSSSAVDNHSASALHWSKQSNVGNLLGRRHCRLVLQATNGGDAGKSDGKKKKGYKFGDLTKGLSKSLLGGSVEKITGKPYEFGDLSRAIDTSIKDKINDLTDNDDYEFGDLSRWVDTKVKGKVNEYTNKENYKFGDLTKEILRRVASGEYTMDDLFMLLKALAIFEASISPVAGFLPVKLLVELLNFSLLQDVGGKVTSALAMELDKRLKKSLLGDENYKLGDATKRTIGNAVKTYTGKDSYEFGDVTKQVVASFADDSDVTPKDRQLIGMKSAKDMEPDIGDALAKWDNLEEKETKDGLDKIEKYVKRVEKEQGNGKDN